MSELEKLKKKHAREIQELQEGCPHIEVSNWVHYAWAPGHYWGMVKYCLRCGKYIERKEPELTSTYGNEDWEKLDISIKDSTAKPFYLEISQSFDKTANEEEK